MGDPWPAAVDWCDITLDSPAENLALDEVMLQQVDADPARPMLRTWHPTSHFVVLGRSNPIQTEVDEPQCLSEGVPILRRASGGGAVVVGPGCLAYSLILPLTEELRAGGVVVVTQMIMETIAASLKPVLPGISVCGTSDLAVHDRKFSGNSQRWLKQAFLHHGTILYDFEVTLIGRLLKAPSRQPDYRGQRTHDDFVANVPVPRELLIQSLVAAWRGRAATCAVETILQARQLAKSRYDRDEWTRDR